VTSDSHKHEPKPAQYWKIAAFLAVLTAIEVSLFYIDHALDLGVFNAVALISLSAVKFLVVIGWFMHVRYEKPMIARFFTAGFVLACALYLIVLAALGIVAIRG
jgi:cytochrome c oxidase subunit 4